MLISTDATSMALASDELELSYRQLAAGIMITQGVKEAALAVHYYRRLQSCRRLLS